MTELPDKPMLGSMLCVVGGSLLLVAVGCWLLETPTAPAWTAIGGLLSLAGLIAAGQPRRER